VLAGVLVLAACSEGRATPGYEPVSPAAADARQVTLQGPCGASADVSVDEQDSQIVMTAVWRGGNDDACVATVPVSLDDPIGSRDIVDPDLHRRWALQGDQWLSLDWCGVAARCDSQSTLPPATVGGPSPSPSTTG
jgi:hypothetical protein